MGTGMIGMQWIIFIGVAVVSWLVQMNLQSKFKKYSKIPTGNGMTGADVALKMLHDNGIYDVTVTHTPGHLTDHYNPANKTVNLSESVYNSNSIMAAAVAAHECGHAVQHARAYAPLTMRSKLVPVVSFASNIMTWVLLGGILMLNTFPQLLLAGIILFAMTTLFSFITLPVEINASKRALVWLSSFRHYECPQSYTGGRRASFGGLYVCGSCARFIGNACLLHNDIHGTQRIRTFCSVEIEKCFLHAKWRKHFFS